MRAVVLLLLVLCCATASLQSSQPDYSCVHAQILSPTNLYYTMVKVKGTNDCGYDIDLDKCYVSYSTNYAAGAMWGSALLAQADKPTFKDKEQRIPLGAASAWSTSQLRAGHTFDLNYGVSLTKDRPLYIKDARFNPPPNDDGVVEVVVPGGHMLTRDIRISLIPVDQILTDKHTTLIVNASADQTLTFDDVVYGKYEVTVQSDNACNASLQPALVNVQKSFVDNRLDTELNVFLGATPVRTSVEWLCPPAYFAAIGLSLPPKPVDSLPAATVQVILRLADNRKVLDNRSLAWNDLLIWSFLPYDRYVVQLGNATDGAQLVHTNETDVNLTYLAVVRPSFVSSLLPVVRQPIVLDAGNATDVSVVFTSHTYHADYVYNYTLTDDLILRTTAELPENDEFDVRVWLSEPELTSQLSPVTGIIETNQTSLQPIQIIIREKQPILPVLSIFWCGFSRNFCGQSDDDDMYPATTHVILAFGNTNPNGSIVVDTMPNKLIQQWHADGKKVLISVGGQNGHWTPIFANPHTFVDSIAAIIEDNDLDGVDLDIEGYATPPEQVVLMLRLLRRRLGADSLIVVSPENVTIYPSPNVGIPAWSTGTGAYNYMVPILNATIDIIDLVQPQFYNNNYLNYGNNGNARSILENYLGWINQYPGYQIPDFAGVPEEKLVIGVPASTSAANPAFYVPGDELLEAFKLIRARKHFVRGVMMWDSHWDQLNGYEVSAAAAQALALEPHQ